MHLKLEKLHYKSFDDIDSQEFKLKISSDTTFDKPDDLNMELISATDELECDFDSSSTSTMDNVEFLYTNSGSGFDYKYKTKGSGAGEKPKGALNTKSRGAANISGQIFALKEMKFTRVSAENYDIYIDLSKDTSVTQGYSVDMVEIQGSSIMIKMKETSGDDLNNGNDIISIPFDTIETYSLICTFYNSQPNEDLGVVTIQHTS